MEQNENKTCTFTATVRTDIRTLASIAAFMGSRGDFVDTIGRIASRSIKILGNLTQKDYPVDTYEGAIMLLRRLGYNDPLKKKTRYYDSLLKELEKEKLSD